MPFAKTNMIPVPQGLGGLNRSRMSAISPGGVPGFPKLLKCGWNPRAVLGVLVSAVVIVAAETEYTPPTSIAFSKLSNSTYRTQSGPPGHYSFLMIT